MSDLETAEARATSWLQPLGDDAAPCGPDLEYDNDFLALTQAAAGKPESQFGAAEPPDWRAVADMAEGLFGRTRDLRVAIQWLRAALHLHGYPALPTGLKLVADLIETQWDHLHPMPDPDDGDPYGRVNALTLLREPSGVMGDLRDAVIAEDRAAGLLRVRDVEAAIGPAQVGSGSTELGKEQILQLVAAAVARQPALRVQCQEALVQVRRLIALTNDKLGVGTAPDLRPVYALVNSVAGTLPAQAAPEEEAAADDEAAGAASGASPGGARRGLSGSVGSRDEALRAIDLVIEYLERAEPTNPAPLFLRRARQLIGHNFLQLMKVLAPDSLAEVARVVGIDPDSVETPDGS